MSSQAQIRANRANAQKSTGPQSAAGKARSAANSSRHGLQANPTTILENNPILRRQYDALKAKLLEQIRPEGELELQAFERHVFATFQADRARQLELEAMDRWIDEPSNQIWFQQMERIQKLAASNERRAGKALQEIRQLQRDRFASLDVQNEMYLLEQSAPIPATLPVAELRRTHLSRTSPLTLAMMILNNAPDIQQAFREQTKPIAEPVQLSAADLLRLEHQTRSR